MNKHTVALHERLNKKHMIYFLNKLIIFCKEIIKKVRENDKYIKSIDIVILLSLSDNIADNLCDIIIWSESSLSLDAIFDNIVKHLKTTNKEKEIIIDKSCD